MNAECTVITQEQQNPLPIQFRDTGGHYELSFMTDFVAPTSGDIEVEAYPYYLSVDAVRQMAEADKGRELHVVINSFGGSAETLTMLLQQVLSFKWRVGICTGTACSAAMMLFFSCQERYVSPFSQLMYHELSVYVGQEKASNAVNLAQASERWWNEIVNSTAIGDFLTEDDRRQGKAADIYFTGRQVIERGAAMDYSEYLSRRPLRRLSDVVEVDGRLWRIEDNGWHLYERADMQPVKDWREIK